MDKPLSYGRPWITEADRRAVDRVLTGDWLTTGPAVEAFERALCELTGARHAVVVSSGTAALHLAVTAMDVGPGDKGLTAPLTFQASANAIAMAGADVALADVDPTTLCLSVEELERHCRDAGPPAVVIAVDFAGVAADLPALYRLSRQYGFGLIEDAAHSVGTTYRFEGRDIACGACVHSDVAVFSFHPVKNITTAEGGAVLTDDADLAARVKRLSNHGVERDPSRLRRVDGPWSYEMVELGFNYRLSDVHCALGLSQLARLAQWKQRRREIVRRYNEALADYDDVLQLPPWPDECDPCFHLYFLRVAGERSNGRLELFMYLRERGIFCQVHYLPVHMHPYYAARYGFRPEDFPHSLDAYQRCLSLPLFPAMTDDDVGRVAEAVISWARD